MIKLTSTELAGLKLFRFVTAVCIAIVNVHCKCCKGHISHLKYNLQANIFILKYCLFLFVYIAMSCHVSLNKQFFRFLNRVFLTLPTDK